MRGTCLRALVDMVQYAKDLWHSSKTFPNHLDSKDVYLDERLSSEMSKTVGQWIFGFMDLGWVPARVKNHPLSERTAALSGTFWIRFVESSYKTRKTSTNPQHHLTNCFFWPYFVCACSLFCVYVCVCCHFSWIWLLRQSCLPQSYNTINALWSHLMM